MVSVGAQEIGKRLGTVTIGRILAKGDRSCKVHLLVKAKAAVQKAGVQLTEDKSSPSRSNENWHVVPEGFRASSLAAPILMFQNWSEKTPCQEGKSRAQFENHGGQNQPAGEVFQRGSVDEDEWSGLAGPYG